MVRWSILWMIIWYLYMTRCKIRVKYDGHEGKKSDGHKKDGIQYSDGSTCCHTSYWHDAPSRLTFRHPWMKLFQLMPRFLGYFGRFSLPLFWVRFCILWTVLKIRGIFWFQGPPFAGIYMSDLTMCRLPIQLRFKGHIWPIIHRLVITWAFFHIFPLYFKNRTLLTQNSLF